MRVADSTRYDMVRANIESATTRLQAIQSQVASGHRVNSPADDPIAVGRLLALQTEIANETQASRTADTAKSRLTTAESALSNVSDIMQTARRLGVQAQSGALSASDRQTIGTQLNQLVQQAVQEGNANYAGQYVFSGAKTTTPAFSTTGTVPVSVAYNGDGTPIALDLQPGVKVRVDVPGDSALGSSFSALISLRDAVNAGDSAATATALTSMDSAATTLTSVQASVGARMNSLDAQSASIADRKLTLQAEQSSLGDTDVADAAVRLSQAQNTYQAALSAAGKLLQTSLLNFLGSTPA